MKTTATPRHTPGSPECIISAKFIPVPNANEKNGVNICLPEPKNFLNSSSKLPIINPIIIGIITATIDIIGKSASPLAPKASIVKNAPALKDIIVDAP